MSPEITFGPSAAETVLEQFGWTVADDGTIKTESGEPAPTYHGDPATIDELGGIVEKDGEPVVIRDNFADVSEWVQE